LLRSQCRQQRRRKREIPTRVVCPCEVADRLSNRRAVLSQPARCAMIFSSPRGIQSGA
jgi:hypothetical protein